MLRTLSHSRFRFLIVIFLLLTTSALYSAVFINRVTREIRQHRDYVIARDIAWEAKMREIEGRVIQQDAVFNHLVGEIRENRGILLLLKNVVEPKVHLK